MFSLDHPGIAVRSLAAAKNFYENLGMRILPEQTVDHEQVRLAMVPVGDTRIEFLEPTSEDSPIGRFLAKRGEGLHHIAVRVTDLPRVVEHMKASGTRFISDEIRIGAGGHAYVFVHPESAGGVLVELCEQQPIGV